MKAAALLCTRNGRERISQAIAGLLGQVELRPAEFEIWVIDNGSSDGTRELATQLLAASPFPSTIRVEPHPGKMSALRRGLQDTSAEIVVIVDDDNVLSPSFIRTTLDLYAANPDVGMIGSHNTAMLPEGCVEPAWFKAMTGQYACAQPVYFGAPPHPESLAIIAGAGSSFRKCAFFQGVAAGYQFINDTTRHGRLWITGEDTELCYLIGALGWKFMDDPRLRMTHILPPARLEWSYARRLARTLGTGCVGIDPFIIFRPAAEGKLGGLRTLWPFQALAKVRRLARHGLGVFKLLLPGFEGDLQVIELERDWGALLRILHERGAYSIHLKRTRAFLNRMQAGAKRETTGKD